MSIIGLLDIYYSN